MLGLGKCVAKEQNPVFVFCKQKEELEPVATGRSIQRFFGFASEHKSALHFRLLDEYSRKA